jgi:hypothetical protein
MDGDRQAQADPKIAAGGGYAMEDNCKKLCNRLSSFLITI